MSRQEFNDSSLKVRSQRAQLTYMLNENDNLKSEVDQLKEALKLAQSSLEERAEKPSTRSLIEQN